MHALPGVQLRALCKREGAGAGVLLGCLASATAVHAACCMLLAACCTLHIGNAQQLFSPCPLAYLGQPLTPLHLPPPVPTGTLAKTTSPEEVGRATGELCQAMGKVQLDCVPPIPPYFELFKVHHAINGNTQLFYDQVGVVVVPWRIMAQVQCDVSCQLPVVMY
jgi:hypothetical protein